jgi:hypothetical protein
MYKVNHKAVQCCTGHQWNRGTKLFLEFCRLAKHTHWTRRAVTAQQERVALSLAIEAAADERASRLAQHLVTGGAHRHCTFRNFGFSSL